MFRGRRSGRGNGSDGQEELPLNRSDREEGGSIDAVEEEEVAVDLQPLFSDIHAAGGIDGSVVGGALDDRNSDEVVRLINQVEASQNRYERLFAERTAAIARDPHNAMDAERIARVNRHFLSRVLPSMQDAFMSFMRSDWINNIDSSLIVPYRMITLLSRQIQELSDSQESDEPVAAGGRIDERIVSICGNNDANYANLMAVFARLNSDDLLPVSSCEYPDLRESFPEVGEEEVTEFPFSDPNIVVAAGRVLLTLRYRLLQEIISNSRDAIAMGLDAEDLPMSSEDLQWIEDHRIIIAIGEIDTRGLNFNSFDGELPLAIGAYVNIHNRIIARAREIFVPHADCAAISAYRNFDFAFEVLGEHGNPFDPNESRHAFTINSSLVGTNNRSAAEHVQVLAAFYYLTVIDPEHPDTDRMRWAGTVGQLADIRNTYGTERVSCYPGAVSRIARFSENHPELALPDTLLSFVQRLGVSILSNAVSNYFEMLRDSDYETRRNAYLALLTFSSFNADAIRVHDLTEVMGQSINLLYFVREDFMQRALLITDDEFIAQIELEVGIRYPGSSLSAMERALALTIFNNFGESAYLAIRGNFYHSLTREERVRFEREDADTDHSHAQEALASSVSQIYAAYLLERDALEEEYDAVDTHAQFLEYIHTVAFERVRVDCLSRFGIAEHLARQEIRDQHLTVAYRRAAEQLLRLRDNNADITWSDSEINSRILGQISRDNRSLWFACSRPESGDIPECDEETSDYTDESLQQAAIRLLLQRRFVAEVAPVVAVPVANNVEVLRVAQSIQRARASYEHRNRIANQAAAADRESSMEDSMLQIGITHFNMTMLPYLRDSYRRYTQSSWLDLLDEQLSEFYRRHARVLALIDRLRIEGTVLSTTGRIFGEEENFSFLRSIGAIRERRAEVVVIEDQELDRIVDAGDEDNEEDEEISHAIDAASTPLSEDEEYNVTCILSIYERLLASDSIELPDVVENTISIDLELDEDRGIELEYCDEGVVQVSSRILLMLRSKILDEIIYEAGTSSFPVSTDLGEWLRENRNIILLGDIEDVNEALLLPRELSSYIFTHNAIVSRARSLLGSINCDLVNAWNCLDMRVSLAARSYPHPFNPSYAQGVFVGTPVLSASGQREAANQATAMLSVVCLNAFEEGEHADLNRTRWASIVGQLSDILNANGLRMASCYPGAIGRILKMAEAHPVIAMPLDIPNFIISTVRSILVPRMVDYFQRNLQDASYSRLRDVYLALMSFSSFYVNDIIDGSMRDSMGVPLNRLVYAWNDVTDTLLLGDPENIHGQVRHEVSQHYNGHILSAREEALLVYIVMDISSQIAPIIRDLFLRTLTSEDRSRFLQAEQEDGDVYICTEAQAESEVYMHYERLIREAIDSRGGEDEVTREIFFRDVFNQVISAVLEFPSVVRAGGTRESVISEIRDHILERRFSSSARLMLELRQRTPSMTESLTDARIVNRIIRDIANEEFSLWFNCRQNREDRNESEEDDFSLGDEFIEIAVMRLRLPQRFVQEREVVERVPDTSVTNLPESSVISEHLRDRASLRSYVFPEGHDVGVIQIRCSSLGMSHNRITNVDEVGPYSQFLHLPALPMLFPYHPSGRSGVSHSSGGITRIFMALDSSLRGINFSSVDFNVLRDICTEFGISHDLSRYDISCSLVVQDYPFRGTEDILARAHPWLHSDAPERGSFSRQCNINVAAIIDNRVRIVGASAVHTHGGQRTSSTPVVFSPNNMHVWTPSDSELRDGALQENKFITVVYLENSSVGDSRPRIKIATTVIANPSTALALDGALASMRTSSDEAIRGILARGNLAEIISYVDSQCSSQLQLHNNMPLDVIRSSRLLRTIRGSIYDNSSATSASSFPTRGLGIGRQERWSPSELRDSINMRSQDGRRTAEGLLTRRNAFRGAGSRLDRRRVFGYAIPETLSMPDSDLTITLSRDLRIDQSLTALEYMRLTNVGFCRPYAQTLSLPQLPMLHPYNPNGIGDSVRVDAGITRVLIAAELNTEVGRFDIAGLFGSAIGDLSDVPITTSIVVQSCPFRNVSLLGRAHPWLHVEAPEFGNWSSQDTVCFAIISHDNIRVYQEGSVYTHGHGEQDQVLFSPNNFRSVEIAGEGLGSNGFYATVYAVMDGDRVERLAVTTHILLTDTDTASLSESIRDFSTAGLELTSGRLLSLLESISGFSAIEHMPWRMVARGALAIQRSSEVESLPVVTSTVTRGDRIEEGARVDYSIIIRDLRRQGAGINELARRRMMRGPGASSLGMVTIIPENLEHLHVENVTSVGSSDIDVLTNLQLFSNPDLGARQHFLVPTMTTNLRQITHPLVAVTYNRSLNYNRLPAHVTRWLYDICSRHGLSLDNILFIAANFCLQQRFNESDTSIFLSLSQSVQSADQIEMIVSFLHDGGSSSEHHIGVGEFDVDMTHIECTGEGNTVYSCILFPRTASIVLTQHLLVPEEAYSSLSSAISSRDGSGRRLVVTRLENLLTYIRGNVTEEHIDLFEDFARFHNGLTRDFYASVSSDIDAIYVASNVNTCIANMGESHPNVLSRQAPLVYGSEGRSPLVPICLHFPVTDRRVLPEYVHRFINRNELQPENIDVDVFFVVQNNPYVRGEQIRLRFDALVSPHRSSVRLSSMLNPRDEEGVTVHSNVLPGNIAFEIFLNEENIAFEALTLMRNAGDSNRDRLVLSMHCLLQDSMVRSISNRFDRFLSELPGVTAEQSGVHPLSTVVDSLEGFDFTHRNLANFANMAYGIHNTIRPTDRIADNFVNTDVLPCYQSHLLGMGLMSRQAFYTEALIRFCIRAMPLASSVVNCIESIIENLDSAEEFFTQEVVENAIRYNNSLVLEVLCRRGVNISYPGIGRHGPIALCVELQHDECAVYILASAGTMRDEILDNDAIEYISGLGLSFRLESILERERRWVASNLDIRAVAVRTPSLIDMEDIVSEDRYEGIMRMLFQNIIDGDITSFISLYEQHEEELASRVFAGNTLMTFCAEQEQVEILDYLGRHGLNIDLPRTSDGRTAMHIAADRGNDDMIRIIMEISTASRGIQDIMGQTPVQIYESRYPDRYTDALFRTEEEIGMSSSIRERAEGPSMQ